MSSPISILVSQDSFLIERELSHIRKKILGDSVADFNLDQFSAKTDPAQTIVNACALLPMMHTQRLVIVKNAEGIKKDQMDLWLRLFENPVLSTKLVLVASKIDRRQKMWQMASKKGFIQELKVPYLNQIPGWISREARTKGLTLSPQAAQGLTDSVGANLMGLIQALEKIETFVMPRKNIELGDVTQLVGDFLSKTVFDLAEKVGNQNLKGAFTLLDEMMTKGEPGVKLLMMITRHFRILLLAQEGLTHRWNEGEFAREMGVHPYFVKDYISQARKMSQDKLKKIYRHLLKTDRRLKSSPLSTRATMDEFVMQVCLEL